VPTELNNMMFPKTLLSVKHKEEKKLAVAARLMDTGNSYAVVDDAKPYGDPPAAIALPPLTTRVVRGLRISPKTDYESIRAQVLPPYTISRFLEDIKNARYRTNK
jgi:hypothetical protein